MRHSVIASFWIPGRSNPCRQRSTSRRRTARIVTRCPTCLFIYGYHTYGITIEGSAARGPRAAASGRTRAGVRVCPARFPRIEREDLARSRRRRRREHGERTATRQVGCNRTERVPSITPDPRGRVRGGRPGPRPRGAARMPALGGVGAVGAERGCARLAVHRRPPRVAAHRPAARTLVAPPVEPGHRPPARRSAYPPGDRPARPRRHAPVNHNRGLGRTAGRRADRVCPGSGRVARWARAASIQAPAPA
jgi:hypothetical protein